MHTLFLWPLLNKADITVEIKTLVKILFFYLNNPIKPIDKHFDVNMNTLFGPNQPESQLEARYYIRSE